MAQTISTPSIADMIRAIPVSVKVAFTELRERVMYWHRMKETVTYDDKSSEWKATYSVDGKEIFHIVSGGSVSVVTEIPGHLRNRMISSKDVPSRFKELASKSAGEGKDWRLVLGLTTKDDVKHICALLNFKYKNLGWKQPL